MKPIKADHWVKTADGTIGRVRYVHEFRREADVALDNDLNNTVTLPFAELRRVTDPRLKRVPVDGIPDPRVRCQFCDKPLAYWTTDTRPSPWKAPTSRVFSQWRGYPTGDPIFCTMDHALKFAIASFKAGMRIVRKS